MKFETPANVSSETFASLETGDYELEAFKTSWLEWCCGVAEPLQLVQTILRSASLNTKKVSNRVPDCTAELGSN